MCRFMSCGIMLIAAFAVAAVRQDEPERKQEKSPKAAEKDSKDGKKTIPAEKSDKAEPEAKPAEKAEKTRKGKPDLAPAKREDEPRPGERAGSALRVGADLPGPLNPYNVNGPRKGSFHCLLSQHGLEPMVLIFLRTLQLDDAFKDLLRQLDTAIDKNPAVHLAAMVVYVPNELKNVVQEDDLREQLAVQLADLGSDLKHVVLALDSPADAARYLVNEEAVVTVLLQRKYRIEAVHFLSKDQLTKDEVGRIMGEVAQKLGAKKK